MSEEVPPLRDKLAMPDHEGLRWLGVWLPVVAVGLIVGLVQPLIFFIHLSWPIHLGTYLIMMVLITTGAYLFSNSIFHTVQKTEREIFRRNQELAVLNEVGTVINEFRNLDEVLIRTLDKVLEVTEATCGEIFLWDEERQELVQRACRGLFQEAFREITRFKLAEGFPGIIAQTGEPLVIHELSKDPRFIRANVLDSGFRSFIGVPLKSKGKIVGVMDVASLDSKDLTSEDLEMLAALGNQMGVGIENAMLYGRLKEMSMLEERQRIAREMHDGLAQSLGYLHLKLGELEIGVSSRPASVLKEEIARMKKITADAYDEVRQSIFGLKMAPKGLGLVPALSEYLLMYSEQTGIGVEIKVNHEQTTRISHHAEVQLIRIIQEALTNVRKHARAARATVAFEAEDLEMRVTIQDDGCGFDMTDATHHMRTSFGLQTMRERAGLLGGTLTVSSEYGKGTQVIVRLPMGEQEAAGWRS